MTQIVVIVAIAQNGVIGRKNDIPWRLSEDFIRFKNLTMGFPCLMGDVTYESLPESSRPLPGRENVILTFNQDYHPEGTTVFYDFDEAVDHILNDKIQYKPLLSKTFPLKEAKEAFEYKLNNTVIKVVIRNE